MTDFFDALTRAIRFARRLVLGCVMTFVTPGTVSAAAGYRADVATIDEQLSKNYVSKAPATEGRLR
jgi:hypothetical protein